MRYFSYLQHPTGCCYLLPEGLKLRGDTVDKNWTGRHPYNWNRETP
nr:MAG TPA: hypothetical protein [Caudoviricetes sp.]